MTRTRAVHTPSRLVGNSPGGGIVGSAVVAAALDCPDECVFLEDEDVVGSDDSDIFDAELDPLFGS